MALLTRNDCHGIVICDAIRSVYLSERVANRLVC